MITIAYPNDTPPPAISFPRQIPASASSDPSERSKPPVSITKVSPIATIQSTAALVISASRFAEVKKRDCDSEK